MKPKHAGKLGLHLAAVVEVGSAARDFTAMDREIAVHVSPVNAAKTFCQANTIWALGILVKIFASAWGWIKKRNAGAAKS